MAVTDASSLETAQFIQTQGKRKEEKEEILSSIVFQCIQLHLKMLDELTNKMMTEKRGTKCFEMMIGWGGVYYVMDGMA